MEVTEIMRPDDTHLVIDVCFHVVGKSYTFFTQSFTDRTMMIFNYYCDYPDYVYIDRHWYCSITSFLIQCISCSTYPYFSIRHFSKQAVILQTQTVHLPRFVEAVRALIQPFRPIKSRKNNYYPLHFQFL